MADDRDRSHWLRSATQAAWFHKTMTGEILDPWEMIPEGLKPQVTEKQRTPEQERHDTRCAMTLIEQALKQRG